MVGQGLTRLLERPVAGFEVDELELEAQGRGERLEDAPARGDHLEADAISGDETWREFRQSGVLFFYFFSCEDRCGSGGGVTKSATDRFSEGGGLSWRKSNWGYG